MLENDELMSGSSMESFSMKDKYHELRSRAIQTMKVHPVLVVVGVCIFVIVVACLVGLFYMYATKTESHTHPQIPQDPVARAKWLHENNPLIDGHNDLPWHFLSLVNNNVSALDISIHQDGLQTDIPRLTSAIYGGQFWSVYVSCSAQGDAAVQEQLGQIDVTTRIIAKYNQHLSFVRTHQEFEQSWNEKKIGSLLGMEGGHAINNSLANLRNFFNLGVRYMTLTHNRDTNWAEAAQGVRIENVTGLTGFGVDVVREMNRLGMMVDISHVSDRTMSDVLNVSRAPVIFSHSGVRAISNSVRNVPDSVLEQVKTNGAVIMVVFYSRFVKVDKDVKDVTVDDVVDHINYINKTIGVDHIGIGSDFDGADAFPSGLKDVGQMRNLTVKLVEGGYSDKDIIKIMGGNILRVMKEVEGVADQMKNVPPSDAQCCY